VPYRERYQNEFVGQDMSVCRGCYSNVAFSELDKGGYCLNCQQERSHMRSKATSSQPSAPTPPKQPPPDPLRQKRDIRAITLTTETALDVKIDARLGLVSAEIIAGMNIVKDMMTGVRDVVGGRSKTTQKAMGEIKEDLFADLQQQAYHKGANMVIGVSLRFSDYGSKGTAILATCIGTAIRAAADEDTP
jgi:uncharacterized protein YbjQ (UPF0145 family)